VWAVLRQNFLYTHAVPGLSGGLLAKAVLACPVSSPAFVHAVALADSLDNAAHALWAGLGFM